METSYLHLLKQEVVRTFGRKILSSVDCHNLCQDIARHTRTTLSFNTLRRFFDLMKTSSKPSVYTFNTLSLYCGFASFDDFVTFIQKRDDGSRNVDSRLLQYLLLLFKDTEVRERNDWTYESMVHQTINYLSNYPNLIDPFQREIARTKNGQLYYFEKFVNFDKLNSFYGRGLGYYANEKDTPEAQIFTHGLLCLRSFLTNDDAGVIRHYKAVMQYDKDTTTLKLPNLAYFYATQLYHAYISNKDMEPILANVSRIYSSLSFSKDQYDSFVYFEQILSYALTITCQYEDALHYITEAHKKRSSYSHSYREAQLLEGFGVYRAFALMHTGREAEAKEVFEKIQTYNFNFLSKQFLTILYLHLKQRIRKNNTEQEQIEHLVQETGFKRLLRLIDKPVLSNTSYL